MEVFRPSQSTPIKNFFLAGSYTRQDYIDSMEGATMSGHLAAREIILQSTNNPAKNVLEEDHGSLA